MKDGNMISENSLRQISHIFCGDIDDYYTYKTGSQLVQFFNDYFRGNDVYRQGFPSRWVYVYNKLVDLIRNNRFDVFLNIILSKEYFLSEQHCSQVEAAEKADTAWKEFNRIMKSDLYQIIRNDGKYRIVQEEKDLILIGSGGFANVYRQNSTGLIIKKLKDDFITDQGIRSRFKREYTITKSLQGLFGIITVYSFDEDNCSYVMEPAETTLEKYVLDYELSETSKINCIRQILHVMKEVHERNIIHRDISGNNIFVISGMMKIADFGLGKDLNVFTSHQTIHTNAMGQFFYCAPEQFMMLREADKRSDVYSLGRVINFVMTKNPRDSHHIFRSISEKATNSDAAYRYADAGQLSNYFEKAVKYREQAENQERIKEKIKKKKFDDEIENYIYNLSSEEIVRKMQFSNSGFSESLIQFMEIDDSHAQHIIQSIDQSYKTVCGRSFEAYDTYSAFAKKILSGNYAFVVKEIAANILRFVAWDVNRFSAQRMVEDILSEEIEPLLEEIVRG
jgi:serine/threonine protein kinase